MGRQTGRLMTGVPTKNKALLPEPLRTGENQGIIMERHRRLCLSSVTERKKISMERAEIISQILAILEDVAEVSPEDVNENSVLMDDLDLSSMEILTIVADLEETFGLRIPEKELRNFVTIGDLVDYLRQESEFPRNTYICVAKDVEEVLELGESLSTDMGTYMEEMIEKKAKEEDITWFTVGKLMDEQVNHTLEFDVAKIRVNNSKLSVNTSF